LTFGKEVRPRRSAIIERRSGMQFPIRDPQNYERLRRLPADQAIACYLDGDFTIGEDSALAEAVQRGLALPLKKEEVEEVLSDCMAEEVSIDECRKRLLAAADNPR
jgi:hypothetical protein